MGKTTKKVLEKVIAKMNLTADLIFIKFIINEFIFINSL